MQGWATILHYIALQFYSVAKLVLAKEETDG